MPRFLLIAFGLAWACQLPVYAGGREGGAALGLLASGFPRRARRRAIHLAPRHNRPYVDNTITLPRSVGSGTGVGNDSPDDAQLFVILDASAPLEPGRRFPLAGVREVHIGRMARKAPILSQSTVGRALCSAA